MLVELELHKFLASFESLCPLATSPSLPIFYLHPHNGSKYPQDLILPIHQLFQFRLQFVVKQLNPLELLKMVIQIYMHQFAKRLKLRVDREFDGLEQLQSHQMSTQRERVCRDLIQYRTRGRSYPEITFRYLDAN